MLAFVCLEKQWSAPPGVRSKVKQRCQQSQSDLSREQDWAVCLEVLGFPDDKTPSLGFADVSPRKAELGTSWAVGDVRRGCKRRHPTA